MAVEKTNFVPEGRGHIDVHARYELGYWAQVLGVSVDRLRGLVKEHGVMPANIRKAIEKQSRKAQSAEPSRESGFSS